MTILKNPIELYDDIKAGRVKLASENFKETDVTKKTSDSISVINKYLAMLRISYIVHQHSHWKCKGTNFYGNHQLFERLYKESQDKADELAEKLIGLFGNDSLDHAGQLPLMTELCVFHSDNVLENSIKVEQALCVVAEDLYNRLKETGEITLGLDDLLMSQVNKSETALYLLKQAL